MWFEFGGKNIRAVRARNVTFFVVHTERLFAETLFNGLLSVNDDYECLRVVVSHGAVLLDPQR